MIRSLAVGLGVLALLVLAGCAQQGSSTSASSAPPTRDGASTSPAPTSATTTAPASSSPSSTPAPRAPRTYTVNITGIQFVGGTLTVQKGDTVHWVHKDGTTPHSVKAADGSFSSDNGLPCPGPGCMTQAVHSTFDHTFDAVGTFDYVCEVHASMHNTVTVVAAAA